MNKRLSLGLLGLTVSVVLVVLAFRGVDWSVFFLALKKVRIAWLFPAVLAMVAAIAIRSLRWCVVSGPNAFRHFQSFWKAQALGYLGNLFFPARAGELIRVAALHNFSGISGAHALSSGVMDRIADGLGAVLVLGGVTVWLKIGFLQGRLLTWFGLLFGGLALLSVVFVVWGDRLTELASRLLGGRSKLAEALIAKYADAFQASQHLRSPSRLAAVGSLTVLSFVCDAIVTWSVTVAFGWSLPLSCGMVVALFLMLASTLPSAPGYVGVFQVACVLALRLYGVEDSSALAYSVVLQLLTFATVLLQGAFIASAYGFKTLDVMAARSTGEVGQG